MRQEKKQKHYAPGVHSLARTESGNFQSLVVFPSNCPRHPQMLEHFHKFLDYFSAGEIAYVFQKALAIHMEIVDEDDSGVFTLAEKNGFALVVGFLAEIANEERLQYKDVADQTHEVLMRQMTKYQDLLDDVYGKN